MLVKELKLRIEYTLKFRDLLRFNLMHQAATPTMHLFALIVMFAFFQGEEDGSRFDIVGAISLYAFIWALNFVTLFFVLLFSNTKTLRTRIVLNIEDEALISETCFSKHYHYWHGIAKIVRYPGFMAVYISGMAAHVIPSRVFVSRNAKHEFYLALKAKSAGSD